jgi:hypothetical protein
MLNKEKKLCRLHCVLCTLPGVLNLYLQAYETQRIAKYVPKVHKGIGSEPRFVMRFINLKRNVILNNKHGIAVGAEPVFLLYGHLVGIKEQVIAGKC